MDSIYDAQKKADAMAKAKTQDPSANPAGKGQFQGKVNVYRNQPVVATKPDAGHAARLRANKARSWQDKAAGK